MPDFTRRRLKMTASESSSTITVLRLLLASQHDKKNHHRVHRSPAQHHHQPRRKNRQGLRRHRVKRHALQGSEGGDRRVANNIPTFNTSRRISCANLPGGCQGGGMGNASYQRRADERVRWTATGNLSRREITLTASQKQYFHDIIASAKRQRKGMTARGTSPHEKQKGEGRTDTHGRNKRGRK